MAMTREHSIETIAIPDLSSLNRDGLHALWRQLHRKPPPKGIAGELLVRTLAWRLQCEREGGLSRVAEQRLARAARDAVRRLSSRSGAAVELSDVPEASAARAPLVAARTSVRVLRPGTRLVREWQGRVHEVVVTPEGFAWDGRTHRSLSVIAKAITGTSWNGWLFFGLSRKPEKVHRPQGSKDMLSPPSKPLETALNKASTKAKSGAKSGSKSGARSETKADTRSVELPPPRRKRIAKVFEEAVHG